MFGCCGGGGDGGDGDGGGDGGDDGDGGDGDGDGDGGGGDGDGDDRTCLFLHARRPCRIGVCVRVRGIAPHTQMITCLSIEISAQRSQIQLR